jgi:DNA (cytosine-5)-methyltransferase 1
MLSMRGSEQRDYPADMPARTDSAGGNHEAVAAAFLSRQFGNSVGSDAGDPVGTITAGGAGKAAVVAAFLNTYYGTSEAHGLDAPMGTDTTRDRRSLVTVEIDGQSYAIVDIGMRMLTPRERFRAQGFPDTYRIETGIGEDDQEVPLSQSAQGRMCGNSVCPDIAEALAGANVPELMVREVAA